MLHEDDDPLSNSLFDSLTNSIIGNTISTINTPVLNPHYEEDPWGGNFNTPDISRSFTSPNFTASSSVNNTSDVLERTASSRKKTEYTSSNVLNGIHLPNIYESLYAENQRSGRISLTALNNIMSKGRISASCIEKIMQIVIPNGASLLTQPEFNTAIALLACAQNKLEISLDCLYRNRNYLPEPNILIEQEQPYVTSPDSPVMIKKPITNGDGKKALDTQHWFENVEEITIAVAPEREGIFFKHVNYIVTNEKKSSIVLRRYSDFWWLWEVLLRRYPFRALPSLPPKKLGGNAAFLEKRRKGLSRFMNAVVRHPVLRQDEIVSKFLTEPSELSVWRKENPPNLDEEFKRTSDHVSVQQAKAAVPDDLDEQLQKTKKRVSAAIVHYINLCMIIERVIRRMNGQAADFSRYSIALNSLAEAELKHHATECLNCQCVVKGYETVAKHMQNESNIMEHSVGNATDGILENLKRFRDLLASYRDMEGRKNKVPTIQTDAIKKRLSANRAKLHQNKGIPGFEIETEKLERNLREDEKELSIQQERHLFIRYCMWSEMIYVHKQQAFISALYQNYVKYAIHFSKSSLRNWQELEESTLQMPTDVHLFE